MKRNQYNRSTLPNDMSIVLYNAAAGQVGPSANFTVNTDDFDIDIPSVVSKKVSKKVNVTLDFNLKYHQQ